MNKTISEQKVAAILKLAEESAKITLSQATANPEMSPEFKKKIVHQTNYHISEIVKHLKQCINSKLLLQKAISVEKSMHDLCEKALLDIEKYAKAYICSRPKQCHIAGILFIGASFGFLLSQAAVTGFTVLSSPPLHRNASILLPVWLFVLGILLIKIKS